MRCCPGPVVVGPRSGWDPALLWHLAGGYSFDWPLAWKPPYAQSESLKKKKLIINVPLRKSSRTTSETSHRAHPQLTSYADKRFINTKPSTTKRKKAFHSTFKTAGRQDQRSLAAQVPKNYASEISWCRFRTQSKRVALRVPHTTEALFAEVTAKRGGSVRIFLLW